MLCFHTRVITTATATIAMIIISATTIATVIIVISTTIITTSASITCREDKVCVLVPFIILYEMSIFEVQKPTYTRDEKKKFSYLHVNFDQNNFVFVHLIHKKKRINQIFT